MKTAELLRFRLHNQRITDPRGRQPSEVVSWLTAMQAQEYAMAKWAIALRMTGAAKDADIERAFNSGEILRTHLMRPTWHFVAPADIRWLLALTAPRVHAANAYMYRKLELDAGLFKRSDAVLARALQAGRFLTRAALQTERLSALVMHAELEGLICSGPREGRQFTYALLETRVPKARALHRDAALEELSRRYFASRGPATAQDFATWSGLTLTDARAGIESLGSDFVRETIDGRVHVFRPAAGEMRSAAGFSFLMPDYDEYGMSYKNRSALLPPHLGGRKSQDIVLAYNRMIVVDGRIVGSWRRTLSGDSCSIETDYLVPLARSKLQSVARATRRYAAFTGPGKEHVEPREHQQRERKQRRVGNPRRRRAE
jgi:hypothetical protein